MSQEELAQKINKTKATISSYELSTSYPSFDGLMELARIFEISLDDFVNTDLAAASGEVKRLTPKLNTLGEENEIKDRLIRMMEYRINELERAIKDKAPGLARELGIK